MNVRSTAFAHAARRRRRVRQARRRRGFTLIEVMISLGVMTVGAMAIISMQQHTIRSNAHAREVSIATGLAELWIERFKQDAHTWTQVGYFNEAPKPTAALVLNGTTYLSAILTNPGVWQGIPSATAVVSNTFDYLGEQVNPSSNDPRHYCVSMRPAWVWFGRAMRVDVRVWWPRNAAQPYPDILTEFPGCDDDGVKLAPGGPQFNNYHTIYVPTVIRVTPLNQ